MRNLLIAGDQITQRLRILQKLQQGARECGDTTIELHVEALFDNSDLEALQAWEAAKSAALGHQALPFEGGN